MRMNTRMLVIRHGETTSNLADRVSGSIDDPELTIEGINQALRANGRFSGRGDLVFSSPKQRCLTTGRLVFNRDIPASQRLTDLNERAYGRFDSGPNSDWKRFMKRLEPDLAQLSEAEKRAFEFGPGIENENELIRRSLGVLAYIANQSEGRSTGISTSGGVIRGVLLGRGYPIGTGSISNLACLEIEHDGTIPHVTGMSGITLGD